MSDKEPIDKILDAWTLDFEPDESLSKQIRARSSSGDLSEGEPDTTLAAWLGSFLGRPGLAAAFAIVFALAGFGLASLLGVGGAKRGSQDVLTVSYRLSIDPLFRLRAVAGTSALPDPATSELVGGIPALAPGLDWLQGQLELSDSQYSQIAALHARYERAFGALFADLLASHQAYQGFDQSRMKSDVTDYFQLFELLQKQEALSEESRRLTLQLLGEVEEVCDASQKERYRSLIGSVYPELEGVRSHRTDA